MNRGEWVLGADAHQAGGHSAGGPQLGCQTLTLGRAGEAGRWTPSGGGDRVHVDERTEEGKEGDDGV